MIIHINEALLPELVTSLAQAYNNLDILDGGRMEDLVIYMCTPGGSNWATAAIIDMINEHKDHTILKAYGEVTSNGIKVLFSAKCRKEILPESIGMYHLTSNTGIPTFEGNTQHNNEYGVFMMEQTNNFGYLEEVNKLVKFTKDELKRIKLNYDVWFNYDRLQEMLVYNKTKLKLK